MWHRRGVIGQELDIAPFETGIPVAFEQASRDGGADAARAIMTTDTHSKEYAVTYESGVLEYVDRTFTVGGMCKGSGMIIAQHGDHDRRHYHRCAGGAADAAHHPHPRV